jgi:DHA1 family multidrug resistance protein-like MFS transporter
LNRDLRFVFASNLVGAFGDGLFAVILPVYMRDSLKADPVQIGVLYGLFLLASAVTLLISGSIADRYDRKKIMIAGWVAWLPVPLIFAFAGNWVGMIPGMLLYGVWLGQPASSAYIVTSADSRRLTSTFTIMSAGWSIGYILSPAIGGFLAGTVGMRIVFYLAFAFYGSACIMLSFIKSQHANHANATLNEDYSFSKLLRDRKLLSLSAFFSMLMFIIMMFRNFVPTYISDVYGTSTAQIGFLGSVLYASCAVLGLALGRLGDLKKKSYALATSLVFGAVAVALMLWSGNFLVLVISFIFCGGAYLTWSMLSAVVGPLAPESCRAKWISVPQTICMFSSAIAPYVGGFLYATSPQYLFIVALVALPILAFLSVRMLND